MSTFTAALRPIPYPSTTTLRRDPAAQAFLIMRIAFTVAPILFGLDKFANVLTDDWTRYLSSEFNSLLPGNAADAMHIVGVVEVVAGLVVAVTPRFGGLLVAAWLGGIIVNLLLVGGYGDIALRDFGLLLGALTLSRLATAYAGVRADAAAGRGATGGRACGPWRSSPIWRAGAGARGGGAGGPWRPSPIGRAGAGGSCAGPAPRRRSPPAWPATGATTCTRSWRSSTAGARRSWRRGSSPRWRVRTPRGSSP